MSNRRLVILLVSISALSAVLVVGAVSLLVSKARHLVSQPSSAAHTSYAPITIPATTSFPGKPLPCGPKAYTDRQYSLVRLSYYRKRELLAYEKFGKHNAAWDSLVRDFLERSAHAQAGVAPYPDPQEMALLARRIVATGCTDPVALTQVGMRLVVAQDYKGGEACLKRAVHAFSGSRYPIYCRLGAAVGMAQREDVWGRRIEPTPATAAELAWQKKAIKIIAASAQTKFFAPPEERVFWNCVLGPAMNQDLPHSRDTLMAALRAQAGANPWLLHMALGMQALTDAWDIRGTGWASQVKPQAWSKFNQGLEVAKKQWELAYKMHPGYPEAAANLITVAMAESSNPRVWFDRAVAAQLDFGPAYTRMIYALLPRWGGSHGEMLRFARECLHTKRFDTGVPMVYLNVVQSIAKEDGDTGVWQDPTVWQDLTAAYEGTAKYLAAHQPERARLLRTNFVLLCWRHHHLDTARQELDTLGGHLDRAAFTALVPERPEMLVASIYAASDQERQAIKQAEQLFHAPPDKKALPAFKRLLRQAKDPHVQSYLRDRIQELEWERQFQQGQWVDLLPTKGLAGWEMARGSMTVLPDGKGFAITPGKHFALLICHIRPDIRYELTCQVEFPAKPVPGIQAGFASELVVKPDPQYDGCSIRRDPPTALCGLPAHLPHTFALSSVPQEFQMDMLKDNDHYTLKINGQTVFENQLVGSNGVLMSSTVGLGGAAWADHSQPVIYRNLRIRKIPPSP